MPACQLLQVPQDRHLEADGHQAVQDPVGSEGHSAEKGASLLPPPTTPGEGDHTPSPKSHLPSVQEEGQPQAVELVRHLRIEERQEATDIVHAVHLCRVASQPPQWAGAERGVASRPT